MLSFMYFYFAWTVVLVKRLLAYLYLWQKKEYRLDKTLDYINTPESKGFLWDRFTRGYFICLGIFISDYLLFSYRLIDRPFAFTLAFAVILIVNVLFWIDAIISIIKFLKRTLLMPKFSAKMIAIFGVCTLFILSLLAYISDQNFPIAWIYQLLAIFIVPFIILVSSLLIKPIEIYKKKQIIEEAKTKRKELNDLKVIAVSGSYGKTTTKDILYELLSSKYRVVKSQKNQNTNLSLARQVISLDPTTEILIAEIGAYKKGDGIDTCVFLDPTTSIVTGLNNQHLILFGSEQNIIEAESESIGFLPNGSKIYINADSPMCHKIAIPKNIERVLYGLKNDSKIYGSSLKTKDFQTSFTLNHNNKKIDLVTNLLSSGNIENLVGAIAIALDFGIEIDSIKNIITKLTSTPGALEAIKKPWGNLINDSYNANINGVTNAIDLLMTFNGKKILVLDDILELGEQAETTHDLLATKLSTLKIDLIILMGRNYANIIDTVLQKANYDGEWYIYDKQKSLVDKIIKLGFDNPTNVLLEGYRSKIFLDKI